MVGLVPISFFYFLHAVHKRGFLFGWLAFSSPTTIFFLWVSTTLLLVSHLSSLILAFGGRADKISRSTIWLCFIPFFCWPTSPSIASYGLLLLVVSVTARCLWTSESIHQVWLEQKTGSVAHMLSRFLLGRKPLVQFALYMLPVYFVLMDYYLRSLKDHQTGNHRGMECVADYFWSVKSIVYFTDWHLPPHKSC